MGCAGSSLNKSLRAELEAAGETVQNITFGLVTGGCQFKGLQSKGERQVKGNCVLALTDKRLVSRGLLGGVGTYEIPAASITGASLSKTFPGGVDAISSVKIDFTDSNGKADSIFFLTTVGTQSKWQEQINAIAKK
jgi:hypothetical protein